MFLESPDAIVANQKATLSDHASRLGITPIPASEVHEHMRAELARAPRPILAAKLIAATMPDLLSVICAVVALATVCLAFASPPQYQATIIVAGFLVFVGVTTMSVALDKVPIITENARWEKGNLDFSGMSIANDVQGKAETAAFLVAQRLFSLGIPVRIVQHTLMQQSVMLDPVLEIVADGYDDSIFVAIYDPATEYCRTAEIS